MSRYVLRPIAVGERDARPHRGLEVRSRELDRDITPDEIRPDEFREAGGRLLERSLIPHVARQGAIHVVDQLDEAAGNRHSRRGRTL